jgi:hypothetical protein
VGDLARSVPSLLGLSSSLFFLPFFLPFISLVLSLWFAVRGEMDESLDSLGYFYAPFPSSSPFYAATKGLFFLLRFARSQFPPSVFSPAVSWRSADRSQFELGPAALSGPSLPLGLSNQVRPFSSLLLSLVLAF